MEIYVVEEFNRWADRGYHQKIACPRHPYLDVIIHIDYDGLCCTCPDCEHRIDISGGFYKKIERMIKTAKQLFREQ